MKEILTSTFLLLLLMVIGSQTFAQNMHEVKENADIELINGFHPSEFYYNNIQLPDGIENSDKKEDQINVAVHFKIVAFEKEALVPINSLEKNELEATLSRFQNEAVEELGFGSPSTPKQVEKTGPKPAIIQEENR